MVDMNVDDFFVLLIDIDYREEIILILLWYYRLGCVLKVNVYFILLIFLCFCVDFVNLILNDFFGVMFSGIKVLWLKCCLF